MSQSKNIKILSRVDTEEQWQSFNPILEEREIGYNKETGRYKIGDGITPWNELSYMRAGAGEIIEGAGEIFNDYENNKTIGAYSHAEGSGTIASGSAAHSEGQYTQAQGAHSHAEGSNTIALGESSHASGQKTMAGITGYYFVRLEIDETNTVGTFYISDEQERSELTREEALAISKDFAFNYADGDIISYVSDSKYLDIGKITGIDSENKIVTVTANTEGTLLKGAFGGGVDDQIFYVYSKPKDGIIHFGHYAYAEGENTFAVERSSHAEGRQTVARGQYAHAEGRQTIADYAAHAEGIKTEAGDHSHAEGVDTKSLGGEGSHSEGKWTEALGNASHAEGKYAKATAETAHAEGLYGVAGARGSHTEGYYNNIAKGADFAHAENYRNEITEAGLYAHAEGEDTVVKAKGAHTEGWNTIAAREYQHVQGKYNKYQDDDGNPLNYADIVGNGSSEEDRSNAYTLDWEGNAWFAGDVKVGSKNEKLITEAEADNKINSKTKDFITYGINDFVAGVSKLETGKLYCVYE